MKTVIIAGIVLLIVYIFTKSSFMSSLIASVLSVWSFYPLVYHLILPEADVNELLIESTILCTLAYAFFFQNLLDIDSDDPVLVPIGDGGLYQLVEGGTVFMVVIYAIVGLLLYWISTKWLPLIYIASIVSMLASNGKCIYVILNAD